MVWYWRRWGVGVDSRIGFRGSAGREFSRESAAEAARDRTKLWLPLGKGWLEGEGRSRT